MGRRHIPRLCQEILTAEAKALHRKQRTGVVCELITENQLVYNETIVTSDRRRVSGELIEDRRSEIEVRSELQQWRIQDNRKNSRLVDCGRLGLLATQYSRPHVFD